LTGETFQVLAAVNLPLIKRYFHVPALSGTEKSSWNSVLWSCWKTFCFRSCWTTSWTTGIISRTV